MAKSENKLRCCQITQFLTDTAYWNWTDEELKVISAVMQETDAAKMPEYTKKIIEILKARMDAKGIKAEEIHGIIHDKDTREVWDDIQKARVVENKPRHIHIDCYFGDNGGTLTNIAFACGLEPQYIEKPEKGRYAWDNMLSYLTHIKYDDKYQYDAAEVVSVGAKTYQEIYSERQADWIKGRGAVKKAKSKQDIDWIETQILTGELTLSELLLTDDYYDIYARNKRRCDDAFDVYGQRKAYKTMQALENGEFALSVFFITGRAGSGKTRFAKTFCDYLLEQHKDDKWQICACASSNPVDDYRGEEILFMDDLRGYSLSASDWLKLLDPHNVSPSSARYHNKTVAARVIVITSEKDPIEFFYYTKQVGGGSRGEALDQFIRRIIAKIQVIPYGEEETRYAISYSGERKEPFYDRISLGGGKRSEERVEMRYGFEETDRDYNSDEAIRILGNDVARNNNPKESEIDGQEYFDALTELPPDYASEDELKQDVIESLREAGYVVND